MSTEFALVTPQVVHWAIERRGLSRSRISQLLKGVTEEQIKEWETGDSYPEFDKAVRLASVLFIPFGFLFLPEPPDPQIPLPDLRTRSGVEPAEPSPDFLDLLNGVVLKQQWYRDYALDHNQKELPFVAAFNVNGVAVVAGSITETLGLSDAFRRRAHSWSDFLTLLSEAVESVGIMVMRSGLVGNDTRRKLSANEFQGFAISDPVAPLVFVNSQDFKTAQVFTLAHEVAHIWVGRTGVSKIDEAGVESDPRSVEAFCNSVAAETLVPHSEFLTAWQQHPLDLQRLARRFWVSTVVILRRALELDKITRTQFFTLLDRERANRKTATSSGGDYYRNVIARHGSRLTDAVIRDVKDGGTSFRDAARVLSIKVPTLVKLVERSK